MGTSLRLVVLATFIALAPAAMGAIDLPGFTAVYKLKKAGFSAAEATISLGHNGDILTYSSRTRAVGVARLLFSNHRIVERSTLKEVKGRIVPVEYRYEHFGSDKDRNISYSFDWDKREVDAIVRGEKRLVPVPEGTVDHFSLQLALMRDTRAGKTDLSYPVIRRGELKTYYFTNLGAEKVKTTLGTFDAIKLQRKKNDDKNTTYTTWYAPDLNYLPVKSERSEGGSTTFTLYLDRIDWQQGANASAQTTRPQSSSGQSK